MLPLGRLANVFLVVATRPDSVGTGKRVKSLAEISVEIDFDDGEYLGARDMADYVDKRLRGIQEPELPTPYRDRPVVARQVAEAVAHRAQSNFLVASTAVQALLAADKAVDIHDTGWLEQMPNGLDESFSQFVSATATRTDRPVSAEVLRWPRGLSPGGGIRSARATPCGAGPGTTDDG